MLYYQCFVIPKKSHLYVWLYRRSWLSPTLFNNHYLHNVIKCPLQRKYAGICITIINNVYVYVKLLVCVALLTLCITENNVLFVYIHIYWRE